MKIIFSGDQHVFYGNQHKAVKDMMVKIRNEKPSIVCLLGDLGEVLIYQDSSLIQELFSIQPTLFVLGNHCLYSHQKYAPPEAMEECLKILRWGFPLQLSWEDKCTYYEKDGVLFLGSILFPDFADPKTIYPTKYLDAGCPTIDGSFINLRGGWLQYTRTLLAAFEKKLQLIDDSKCKNIVIITHYCCFISQYNFNPNEEISYYFFCSSAGEIIKKVAERNSDKKFYIVGAHGHEYNVGQWVEETPNLIVHGIKSTYNSQDYISLDIPANYD